MTNTPTNTSHPRGQVEAALAKHARWGGLAGGVMGRPAAHAARQLAHHLFGASPEPPVGLPRLLFTLMHPEMTQLAQRCRGLAPAAAVAALELTQIVGPELARLAGDGLAREFRRALRIDVDRDAADAALGALAGELQPAELSRHGVWSTAQPPGLDRLGAVVAEAIELPRACRVARRATCGWEPVSRLMRAVGSDLGMGFPADASEAVARRIDVDAILRELADGDLVRQVAWLLGRRGAASPRPRPALRAHTYRQFSLGRDLARVEPFELALLADAAGELLFTARFAERRLRTLDSSCASEFGRRGPIIALVDASASMQGQPETRAKAFVLALAKYLLRDGRALHVVQFSGTGQQLEYVVGRGVGGEGALLKFLGTTFHGGTDFDSALLLASAIVKRPGLNAAGVVMVTDGKGTVGEPARLALQASRVCVVNVEGAVGLVAESQARHQ